MHNFAGADPVIATPDGDSRQLIAADLRNLIAQIETVMRRVDAALARDEDTEVPGSADVFVLDDVTPGYATASAALGACRATLDVALQLLSESGRPRHEPCHAAAAAPRRPHLMA